MVSRTRLMMVQVKANYRWIVSRRVVSHIAPIPLPWNRGLAGAPWEQQGGYTPLKHPPCNGSYGGIGGGALRGADHLETKNRGWRTVQQEQQNSTETVRAGGSFRDLARRTAGLIPLTNRSMWDLIDVPKRRWQQQPATSANAGIVPGQAKLHPRVLQTIRP